MKGKGPLEVFSEIDGVKIWALLVVVGYATMGGFLFQVMMKGATVNSGKVNFTIPHLPESI